MIGLIVVLTVLSTFLFIYNVLSLIKEKSIKMQQIGNNIIKIKYPFLKRYIRYLEKKFALGGIYNISIEKFIGLQVLIGMFCAFFYVLISNSFAIISLVLSFFTGIVFTMVWLKQKIKNYQNQIFKSLPDTLDLLTLLVESGLDFWSGMNIIIENGKGELNCEFRSVIGEIKLGKNRIDAFTDMCHRVNNKYLTSVITSIVQSLQTGTPVGTTLRMLSEQFRTERSLIAEKLGSEAQIKIMIPMVLFIFPTIFIIIFVPIIISLISGRIF